MGGGLDTKNGDFAITTFKKDKSIAGKPALRKGPYLNEFPFAALKVMKNSSKTEGFNIDSVAKRIENEILKVFGFNDMNKEKFVHINLGTYHPFTFKKLIS